MNSELNDYKISNRDGVIKKGNDSNIKITNETSRYIQENSLSNQNEKFSENETFERPKEVKPSEEKTQQVSSDISKSITQTATSTASSTSAISSGLGTVVGGVASSVATAVIVVATFISIMTMNITLLLAGANCLIFQLDIINAQEQDFATPIYATLEGNGYLQTQEIFIDSVYLTFEDLEPGTEYTLTIKNDEKVFVEQSYFTATNDIQKAFLDVWNEENTIYAIASVRELAPNEYYTITAKDNKGNVLLMNSDIAPEKEYMFEVENSGVVGITLSINGKVHCFEQITFEKEKEHVHNYLPRGFVWEYDENDNLIAFGEGVCKDCEDVLRIPAQMSKDGDYVIASITYNKEEYTDKRVVIDLTNKESIISEDNYYLIKPNTFALGNLDSNNPNRYDNNANYPYIITGTAQQVPNCINIYNSGLSILNVGYKSDYYFELNNLNIIADDKINSTIIKLQTKYDVTIHIVIRGDVYFETSNAPSFNIVNDGNNDVTVTFDITFADENCSFTCYDSYKNENALYSEQSGVNVIFNINGARVDSDGEPVEQEELEPEYDFSQPSWNWSNDYLTAYISFPDLNGGEDLVLEAQVQDLETPATCEQSGSIVHNATIYVQQADDMFEDQIVDEIEPIGHDYVNPVFNWTQNGNNMPTATVTFTCANDSSHTTTLPAEVSIDQNNPQAVQYIATITFEGQTYSDTY